MYSRSIMNERKKNGKKERMKEKEKERERELIFKLNR